MKHRNTCHQKSFASFNMEGDFDLCIAGQSLNGITWLIPKNGQNFPQKLIGTVISDPRTAKCYI